MVRFTQTAEFGGHRRGDEGIENLIPGDDGARAKKERVRLALLDLVRGGGKVTRRDELGDAEQQLDPAVFYEFRLEIDDVPLFVKTRFDDDDRGDPSLIVISVKRWDRA